MVPQMRAGKGGGKGRYDYGPRSKNKDYVKSEFLPEDEPMLEPTMHLKSNPRAFGSARKQMLSAASNKGKAGGKGGSPAHAIGAPTDSFGGGSGGVVRDY